MRSFSEGRFQKCQPEAIPQQNGEQHYFPHPTTIWLSFGYCLEKKGVDYTHHDRRDCRDH